MQEQKKEKKKVIQNRHDMIQHQGSGTTQIHLHRRRFACLGFCFGGRGVVSGLSIIVVVSFFSLVFSLIIASSLFLSHFLREREVPRRNSPCCIRLAQSVVLLACITGGGGLGFAGE